jgi:magnesium chelatase accessory protein
MRDGQDWPHREASRFVDAAGIRWHVQTMGKGPVILLVHGTGASSHSWRELCSLLARDFTVVVPDLPGHGFSGMPARDGLSLPGMAAGLASLLEALELEPELAVGHSAGAAVLLRAAIDGKICPRLIISVNGALLPLRSPVGQFFSPLAKILATSSLVPQLMSWRAASRRAVERLLAGTGSKLESEGVTLYARLFQDPAHVAGALGMMASWDLDPLAADLPRLKVPLILVAGGEDRAISPDDAFRVRSLIPEAMVEYMPGLGHLAHEERPRAIHQIILEAARGRALLPAA